MSADLVIVGIGGHGREVFGIVNALNAASPVDPPWRVLGFVDDAGAEACSETNLKRIQALGATFLGTVDWLRPAPASICVVIGIGDPRSRRAVGARIDGYRVSVASLIHPEATIGLDTIAGAGLVAFAGVRVTTNVRFGRHVHLNQNVTVGHDCVFDDYVSVHPLASVSGSCHLDAGVVIGTNAAILPGLSVGRDATVGAGAVVVANVLPAAVVKGVPAR